MLTDGMLILKEPVRGIESERYSVVLEDADGVTHFWLPNGEYDGYSRECDPEARG